MPQTHPRIERERKTVEAMIRLFCRNRHGGGDLCPACEELLAYAESEYRNVQIAVRP